MILILISIITLIIFSIFLQEKFRMHYELQTLWLVVLILALMMLSAYPFLLFEYYSAVYKKEIINREYKTNYSQAEVFYASDVIDEIRDLDRNRIELNGSLIRE